MAEPRIQIQMFGTFSLRAGDAWIDDSANRSHKVWLLLAYLIYHRHRTVTQEELIDKLKSAFDFIKRNYNVINTISGILLILVGILMMTGMLGRLMGLLS